MIFKEFRIALLVGIGLAIANGIRIFIMYKDLKMAIVIALSLSLIVIIAKIIGCTLPLFAKKLHMHHGIAADHNCSRYLFDHDLLLNRNQSVYTVLNVVSDSSC